MSAPGRSASTAALALSAGAGAAAATSLLLAWSWWQQGRDAQQRRRLSASAHESSCPAVHGANSQSQSLVAPAHAPGGRCRAGSLSQSRARLDTHESSRVSECSYLEDREYEHYEQLAEEDEAMDEEGEAEEPAIYMCPHCSNYINPSELIVPGPMVDDDGNPIDDDEDGEAAGLERAQSVQAARILSAAEQLSIQQALRESLQQIFVSVDEDGDGLITRDEMGAFLKKLGLTGEREAAFLNIIGGDSVQPFALTSAAPTPDSKSAAGAAPVPSGDKRGSHSSQRGSGVGGSSGGGGSHNGSLSGVPRAGSGAGGGVRVGINFRQFFERFQDTLEGMDALNPDASDDEATIPTNPVHLDPSATFSATSPDASPALAPVAAKSAPPFPEASLLFTPPRAASSSVTSASSSRLTVNTTTPSGASSGSLLQPPPSSASSALNSPLFSPSTAAAVAAAASPSIRVFLGGACGDTTWRADVAIPQLTAAGVSFYDPQVKDWSPKLVALEGLMKAWCKILFFVIGKQTRALASMIEVAALIAAGRKVVLVVEPVEPGVEIEGQVPSSSEVKDLNRARSYLRDVAGNYNIPVHSSADEGIKAIIAMEEEEKKELRARLQLMRENSLTSMGGSQSGAPGSASTSASGGGHRASFSVSRPRGRGSVMLNGAALALALAQSSPNPHSSPPQSASSHHHHAPHHAHSLSGHKKMHGHPTFGHAHTLPQPLPTHRDTATAVAALPTPSSASSANGAACTHRHTLSSGSAPGPSISVPSTPTNHVQQLKQKPKL